MAWTIFARHPGLLRHGEIDFKEFEAVVRFNDRGTWTMKLDGRSPLIAQLVLPRWGIEVVDDDGRAVLAGPIDRVVRDHDDATDLLTLYGSDDNTYLAERVVHPQPASEVPPYSVSAYDVRTGQCSTVLRAYANVNAAASAVGPRQVAKLTVDSDPLLGTTVTGRGRWQNLLTFLQELAQAGGGLGFRIRQVGATLKFQVYMPIDRSATVQFSPDKGNLASYSYAAERSSANYFIVGGGGEGTARTIREGQDSAEVARWRRIESFVDRRDTTDTAELDQTISKEITEGRGETSAQITPIDLDGSAYLVDYDLGDTVPAIIDGDTVTGVIREVKITITEDGRTVQPSIGTPGFKGVPRMIRALQKLGMRMTNLERR